MEIVILRHGKTPGNLRNAYVGSSDEPLSPEGIELAGTMGRDEDTGHVFVSPLRRTSETAAILFPNAEQTVAEDLREMDFGVFELRTAEEMKDDEQYRSWVEGDCLGVCPGGESIVDVVKRTVEEFSRIVAEAMERGEDRVVIVAHGGTIMSVMYSLSGEKREFFEWFVPNCCGYSLTVNELNEGRPVIEKYSYKKGV